MENINKKLSTFLKTDKLAEIDFYCDTEKIVFHDTRFNKKFLLTNTVFVNYFNTDIEKIGDPYEGIGSYIMEYARLGGFKESNDKLEVYRDIGLYLQSFAEFIIIKRDYNLEIGNFKEFTIGEQKIEISSPSNMFRVIFKHLEENHDFRWAAFNTIKLYNIQQDIIEEYLQQVLFLLEYHKPWYFQLGYKSTYEDKYYATLKTYSSPKTIKTSTFHDPICFYNEAVRRYYSNEEDETSFLYFYKVVEFFFLINRKNEIIMLINNFSDNINELLKGMNELYRTEERQCLLYILKNELINSDVKKLIYTARKERMLTKRTAEELTSRIYLLRNSIAHGKGDSKYNLRLPHFLKWDIELTRWNGLMKQLAEICINAFCYNSKLKR